MAELNPKSVPETYQKAPEGGRLGKYRKMADAFGSKPMNNNKKPDSKKSRNQRDQERKDRRRNRYADQRHAAKIWNYYNPEVSGNGAGKGVIGCGWTLRAEGLAEAIRIDQEGKSPRAYLSGTYRCDLRWVCPCCTIKKSEEGRKELNAALAQGRRTGLRPVMLTLTARHKRNTALKEFWRMLSKAMQGLIDSRTWKKMNDLHFSGGFAKTVEITHGKNGWHPHLHMVIMTNAPTEEAAINIVEDLRAEWLHQLDRHGLDGRSKAAQARSFDVRGAATAGDYITKWGAAEEMTLAQTKVGAAEGRTPWQLLRDARTDDDEREQQRAAALWYEFVTEFKSVHQLQQSPKFKALVKAGLAFEEQEAQKKQAEAADRGDPPPPAEVETVIAHFDETTWTRARWRRVRVLEAAEHQDIEQAKSSIWETVMDARTDADDINADDIGPLIEDDEAPPISPVPHGHASRPNIPHLPPNALLPRRASHEACHSIPDCTADSGSTLPSGGGVSQSIASVDRPHLSLGVRGPEPPHP